MWEAGMSMTHDEQLAAVLEGAAAAPPFSFAYGGTPFGSLRAAWATTEARQHLDSQRTQHAIAWTDPATGLRVRLLAVVYHDSPTLEWTVTFQNQGARDTPSIAAVLALDLVLHSAAAECVLHTNDGSTARASDFRPHTFALPPHQRYLFYSMGGRPTNGYVTAASPSEPVQGGGWPYYNLDWGPAGLIVAIGWPGQWACQMTRDGAAGLHLQAGMSSQPHTGYTPASTIDDARLLTTILHPGETVRTPLIVLQAWHGDWIAGQNAWRRWMLAHNTPQLLDTTAATPSYRPPPPICPTGAVSDYTGAVADWRVSRHGWMEGTATDEATWLHGPDGYAAHGLTPPSEGTALGGGAFDHWWMDAGWHTSNGDEGWVSSVGNWTPDPARFPHGLQPVSEMVHAHHMRYVLWHEPERARPGTAAYDLPHFLGEAPATKLLDWGDPAGLAWAIETFDTSVVANGLDVFRQDFNMDPLPYWNAHDTADRQGLTQATWVEGLLAFWDELRRRHPALLIDTCASGGRRLDLETLRRAVPLTRSDYRFEPMGVQGATHGLSLWLPYHGDGTGPAYNRDGAYGSHTYFMRSDYCPCFASSVDIRGASPEDWQLLRRMTAEWWQIAPCLLGDYYPLTPHDCASQEVWLAWQFDRPEAGEGMVQAFRRRASATATMALPLRGLDVTARYAVYDFDTGTSTIQAGAALATAGLSVTLGDAGSAAVYRYTRLPAGEAAAWSTGSR
jgi:alpha-galactosidase